MKLIIAILRDTDNDKISHALTSSDFRVTCIASTGGFLRRGQATLLIGLDDNRVEDALKIIRENSSKFSESDPRHTTLFVVNVAQFIQY